MTTFLLRLDPPAGSGPTLAVKDLIDVEGTPTTAACRPVARNARPATADAPCVATARAGGARIVGKTNLHELAFGGTGINEFTGTPVNPLDPLRIPGGSSSGSAVAVATGEADIALGTDTGGSIRTPAACCGVVGLKTTYGRISTAGVWPLAPSLDTVGPMAASVAGVVAGMRLLEPGFGPSTDLPDRLGRFRVPGVHPEIEAAVDRALTDAELGADPVALDGWMAADGAGNTVAFAEAWIVDGELYRAHPDELTPAVAERLVRASRLSADDVAAARGVARVWRVELDRALHRHPVIALAAILDEPPLLTHPVLDTRRPNIAVNLSGHPAIVVPLPRPHAHPTAVELIAGHDREDLLVAVAARIEAAVGRVHR